MAFEMTRNDKASAREEAGGIQARLQQPLINEGYRPPADEKNLVRNQAAVRGEER